MASSSVKDTLILLKKRLERAEDDKTILHTIHKLSKFPVTLDILQGTGAGKVMRSLAKRSGEVGIKATSVLNKWRQVVADSSQKSDDKETEYFKKSKHSKNNHESFNMSFSPDTCKQSTKHEKHSKDKHDKIKHSKEKHSIKAGHEDHTIKKNGNVEKESKKYLKDTSNHSNKNLHSINSSAKYNYETEDIRSDYTDCSYNPDYPEIYPSVKNSLKREREDSKMNNHGNATVTYEPSPKKPKLEKSLSSEKDSSMKQISVSNLHHSSDSLMKHSKDNGNFHKKKPSKSSKDDIKKSGHLTEKSSKNSDNIKKGKDKDETVCKAETKKTSKKIVIQNAEEFTASEASFEDCLSFNDILPINKKKSSKFNSSSASKKPKNDTSEKDNLHKMKSNSIMTLKSPLEKNKICDANTPEKLVQIPSAKYKEVDMVSKTLPQPLPNYRPLPQRNYDERDPTPIKKKVMSNEEAIKFTSSRREKTAVYSGRKNHYLTEVPSLFECCTRVLIENIDDIEYMGEIPFFLLESMLRRCTPMQLYRLEHFNPYLLEDTNELWEIHCRRDYRTAKPQENETWRELYWRSHDEQEQRLRSVTANITASIANSNPVRKAKLAYIDAVVKPPREVARKQAKNGTALPTSHSPKAVSPSKSSPKPIVPAIKAASTSRGPAEYKPQKPKVAPLMAKTLKSMKQCFRR